jgi:MYXO-CTERM domain-containing protein
VPSGKVEGREDSTYLVPSAKVEGREDSTYLVPSAKVEGREDSTYLVPSGKVEGREDSTYLVPSAKVEGREDLEPDGPVAHLLLVSPNTGQGRRASSRKVAIALAVATWVYGMGAARANGRFPAANQLVLVPGNPSVMWLRTTFGMLTSTDGGAHFHFVCERAIGLSDNVDPPIAATAAGTILAGTTRGLATSTDGGCGWGKVGAAADPIAGRVITDVTVPPDRPHQALALSSTYASSTDAGVSTFSSQLFISSDDAATFTAVGAPLDPTVVYETVEVAASQPGRVYVSGARLAAASAPGLMFVSDDGGAHFIERAVPYNPTLRDRLPFLAAVDPANPDRVYVRTLGDLGGRLLVSDDAGQSFRVVYSGGAITGFALSPDGKKVFFGGASDGLYRADSVALVPQKVADLPILCLTATSDRLFACSSPAVGFDLGASSDDGATFTPVLAFEDADAVSCPADAPGASCATDWAALKQSNNWGADGGVVGSLVEPPKHSGCAVSQPAPDWRWIVALLVLVAFALGRRRHD